MTFDKNTGKFTLNIEPPSEEVFYAPDTKWLELYVRRRAVDTIKYGSADEKVTAKTFNELENVLRIPMEYVPDPRVVKEDAHDAEQFERDMRERAERAEEERQIKLAQDMAKKEEKEKRKAAIKAERENGGEGGSDEDGEGDGSGSEQSGSKSGGYSHSKTSHKKSKSGAESMGQSASKAGKSMLGSDEQDSDEQLSGDQDSDSEDGRIGDLPDQPAMKRELIQAIEDERREYQELKKLNEEC